MNLGLIASATCAFAAGLNAATAYRAWRRGSRFLDRAAIAVLFTALAVALNPMAAA